MTNEEKQQLLDLEHLRLLRWGYLMSGGANAVWALFPLIHISLGTLMLLGGIPAAGKASEADTRFIGLFMIVMASAFSAMFATVAVLKLVTARRLRERRSKTFCLVTAGLSCIGIPYGTALGVFTFIVLGRPSVDAMFRRASTGAVASSPAR